MIIELLTRAAPGERAEVRPRGPIHGSEEPCEVSGDFGDVLGGHARGQDAAAPSPIPSGLRIRFGTELSKTAGSSSRSRSGIHAFVE